ncbi:flippase [Edaphobacter aggregans]|uniref:flippase n=1 Tax=Edaphobacter aggregans TaxID=570835 RepID=UPI0005540CA2|nr:flippase [Edaphobacter aggregans]
MIAAQIKRIRQNTLARNAAWIFAGQGLSFVIQALYFVFLARLLNPTQYGVLAGAVALVTVVSQYSTMGSGLVLLRYVSQDQRRFPEYWGNVLMSTIIYGSLIVLILHLTGHWLVGAESASLLTLIAFSDCICGQFSTCAAQVFQAFERMRLTATLNLLTNLFRLTLACMMLLIMHHAVARQWAVAMLIISLCATCAAFIIVTRHFGWPHFTPRLLFTRSAEGFVFAVSGSTTSAYNDFDKVMLGHYGMTVANGIYSMAYRVINIATMPIQSIEAAAFPRFFREGAKGITAVQPLATKILKRTVVLGLAAAAGIFLLAPIVPFFIGKGFTPSISALRWLCLIPFFRSFHLCAGDAIAGVGQQKLRLLCQIIAAGSNFGLNLYLIPHYSWRGAAIASLLTDAGLAVLTWSVLFWLRRRERKTVLAMQIA